MVAAALMAAACFGAARPAATTGEQAQQKAGPDVLVYVTNGILVPSAVMPGAQATASRMFAGIGLRVQWTVGLPTRVLEFARTPCTSVQPEVIVIRMASNRPGLATGDALASALPYVRTGTHITVFYGELQEAARALPRLASILLAHVLVHEITHVLQGVARHSSAGVMRAHWTTNDYGDMLNKPLEFTAIDVDLIRKGQAQRRAEGCISERLVMSTICRLGPP